MFTSKKSEEDLKMVVTFEGVGIFIFFIRIRVKSIPKVKF